MMIAQVELIDLAEIRSMIEGAIRDRVVHSEQDVQGLVALIDVILREWELDGSDSVHLKYVLDRKIVGVALVKNFSNLSTLFVTPDHQRQGIGRALIEAVVGECKPRSSQPVMKVNSSTVAVTFYLSLGFRQMGPGLDRPGGCIPLEYAFAGPPAAGAC
jgi:GNAT superfamily N-acetyltransferase